MIITLSFFFVSIQSSYKKGTVGFEQHIDKCLDLSAYLYNKIKNREGFEMVFNGEVRLLWRTDCKYISNEHVNIHCTELLNKHESEFTGYLTWSAEAIKENCLLCFAHLQQLLAFAQWWTATTERLSVLTRIWDWSGHYASLTCWQEKLKFQKALDIGARYKCCSHFPLSAAAHQRLLLVHSTEPARPAWWWGEAGEVAQGNDSLICF